MEVLIGALISAMRELEGLYSGLLRLSESKMKSIKAGDTDAIYKIIKDERDLVSRIGAADVRRSAVAEKLAQRMRIDPAELTIERVLVVADRARRAELTKLRNSLLNIAEQQRLYNEINHNLIQSNLSYIEYMINSLSGATTLSNNYGRSGAAYGNEQYRKTSLDINT